jgi:hypothetical protein
VPLVFAVCSALRAERKEVKMRVREGGRGVGGGAEREKGWRGNRSFLLLSFSQAKARVRDQ